MSMNTKQRGLGMGLNALFENSKPVETKPQETVNVQSTNENSVSDENAIQYIDVNDIKPNYNQPRKHFDEEKIQELSDSIVEHGIIQPLIVRKSATGYEIVAGERRYRAARKANLKQIPCIVRDLTDEENMLITIIENMQREDLNPIEEAEGLDKMIKTFGLTQEEVSKSVGKSRPYITNAIRLLNLPDEVRDMLSKGELSAGHARAVLSQIGDEKQIALAKRIVNEGLSVRSAEKLASEEKPTKARAAKRQKKNLETIYVEDQLKNILGTKVNISGNSKSGSIQIEYYSTDELNRLIDLLRSLGQTSK